MAAVTPAIRASQIPVPARDGRCSRCACVWEVAMGLPSPRTTDCGDRICACHSVSYAIGLYEGSSPDLDNLTSSGAQE